MREPVNSRATLPPLDLGHRIPELDGIRGIAIAMVLVHHYFLNPIKAHPDTLWSYVQVAGRLTWSGVDFFFVLSGFLIGGILLDARGSSNYFHVFYKRRFFRIVPAYAVVLAAVFALFQFGHWRFDFMNNGPLPWVPYLFFVQNFWIAAKLSFGIWSLGLTWSLAVEEQFYLTLPFLVRFLRPNRLLAVIAAGVVGAPILRILLHVFWQARYRYGSYVLMPCRADALLMGVLGAFALRDPHCRALLEEKRRGLQYFLLALAIGFIVLTLFSEWHSGIIVSTAGQTWLALFYLCVLLNALVNRQSWIGRCFRWRWLGWLGSIAYSTYLFHEGIRGVFFALFFGKAPKLWTVQVVFVTLLALFATLLWCQLLWIYFEKPLVKIGHCTNYEFQKSDGSGV